MMRGGGRGAETERGRKGEAAEFVCVCVCMRAGACVCARVRACVCVCVRACV